VLPVGFVMEEGFVVGLKSPTDLKIAPDGRIFVTEKSGAVRIVENGTLLDQAFYSVQTQTAGERGLDGIVLDPDFDNNGFVYLYYTLASENRNIVVRVTAAGNTAIPGSEVELLRLDLMWAAFHNGASMVFDTTGMLLIGVGDGTKLTNSQDMTTRLGKILRIAPDGSIPTDNPFYTQNSGLNRAVAAYGVRNPYTMAVSRITGRVFFNDVGNSAYEEVNEYHPGKNYGWHHVEGPLGNATPPDNNYLDPIHAYDHDFGCAVIGATFYEPDLNRFPIEYFGSYFFMELCAEKIMRIDPENMQVTEFASGLEYGYNNIEASPDGHLYLVNFATGKLSRISFQGIGAAPLISVQPEARTMAVGETVSFEVAALGADLNYDWYRDGVLVQTGIGNSLSLTNLQMPDDQAKFHVLVSNSNGMASSDTANLSVVNGSRPSIQLQGIAATYAAGDSLIFSANVTDPDQMAVPGGDLTWKIDFVHDEHQHPALAPLSGTFSGGYLVETYGEVDTNVYFRIHLTAVDSTGLTATAFADVLPEKVTLLLQSSPKGVEISIDGKEETTDFALRSVSNLTRTIEVPPYAIVGDSLYEFVKWYDGQDSMTRAFSAAFDTIGVEYAGLMEYFHGYPAPGNMEVFIDTGGNQQFYRAVQVTQVKENWDALSPFWHDQPNFPGDFFSVKWEGDIVVPVSDEYTFYLLHDSQIRDFSINGQLVLEGSRTGINTLREDTVRMQLNRGDSVHILINYDHFLENSRVQLDWQYSIVERHTVTFGRPNAPAAIAEAAGGILIFPNPVRGETLNFSIDPEANIGEVFELRIRDVQGRPHQSFKVERSVPESISFVPSGLDRYQISVSDLVPGMYVLILIHPEGQQRVKFIRL
jgi:glucose/arabinose dehydrogenase